MSERTHSRATKMHGIKSALLEYAKDGRTIKNISRWLYDNYNLSIDNVYLSGYLSGCGFPQTRRSQQKYDKLVKVFDKLRKSDPDGMSVLRLVKCCGDDGVPVSHKYIYGFATGLGYPLVRSSHGAACVRKETVLSMRDSGRSYSEIGEILGVSRQRAYKIATSDRKPTNPIHRDELP